MHVSFVTMPYKDPEKRREFLKRWRERNREKLNARRRKRPQEKKRVRELRVVLTPLTRDECQVPIERLQRRKAVARDIECRGCAERARERREAAKRRKLEQNKAWKKAHREKVRESKRKWREKNRERVNEQRRNRRKKAREQKRQWVEKNRERDREQKQRWRQNNRERNREQKRRWRQLNREKDREQRRRQRQADPEKVREQQRRRRQADPEKARARERNWYQANRERLKEQKQRWRKNNPEKVAAQRERERAKLKGDEARWQGRLQKGQLEKQEWRQTHPEEASARLREWRKDNPKERNREVDRACCRRYYAGHKEQCNQRRREHRQGGRPVPLPPPPCDCGICLACGGWGVSWKPAWYARLDAFCTPRDPSTPATILEELPLDLLESETETMSLASTSEIGSELGDRLDSLLMDESDSEVETGDKVEAPTRRSTRIAEMPSVSYKDWDEEESLMAEFLRRKTQLHADGVDRIVTRWELLEQRTERVDAIVNEMSTGMDPTHQLDRFHSQLERQDYVLDVMVSEDLLDLVDGQLA